MFLLVLLLFISDELDGALMILANAIYFKGTWRHQFPKNLTRPGGFYVATKEVVPVEYMMTSDTFYYIESRTLNSRILRLPYKVLACHILTAN